MSEPVIVAKPVQRLGRYALLERLGVGGMAEVYLAEQIGAAGFQKKVVVKRILPHLAADRQFVEMFAREAKVAARVSHPNVVQIFELGEQDNEFFIAMEHIDGLTLHRLAASSWEQGWALPVDVVCRTMADAALGLHAAHSLSDEQGRNVNLVHRDVSPDNLMVSKDGVTKVLDFGIAKGDVGGPKTKTGNLRGKIPFMPPEQITGEVLDGRADLYALGVSMYWMLTGERPFDRQSDWHTMHAILNDTPKLPSTINPGVPAGLDELIMQLLGKTRETRPASGRDVADRLEDLASNGSMGGKKTTVAFLAQLLPAAPSRGNPVSEVQQKPDPKPPVGHTVPAFGGMGASQASQAGVVPVVVSSLQVPEPQPQALSPQPQALIPQPQALMPVPTVEPFVDVTHNNEAPEPPLVIPELPATMSPTTSPPEAPIVQPKIEVVPLSAPLPSSTVPDDPKSIVQPVTTPAQANAFGNVLAPAKEGGIPAPVMIIGVVVVIGVIIAGGIGIKRLADSSVAPVVVDAGVAVAPAVVDAGPPPQPPVKPPITIKTTGPTRVRWLVDDKIVGLGAGNVSVPAGTSSLVAEDLRWKSRVTVPVNNGLADYEAMPSGTIQLIRTSDKITVKLGDDDVSRLRKIKLVAGRYVFKVEKAGSTREIPVDVKVNQTISLDVAK